PVYNSVIPDYRLVQGKAHTFTMESKNSQLRHYLARLIRKTKYHSTSAEMLSLSLILLLNKYMSISI
ncbi:MAG: hypothetical protein LBQ08_04210, partial [Holosporaceae bacterium]|nr:hypothetical protein [Holosporaceae bacterium]